MAKFTRKTGRRGDVNLQNNQGFSKNIQYICAILLLENGR